MMPKRLLKRSIKLEVMWASILNQDREHAKIMNQAAFTGPSLGLYELDEKSRNLVKVLPNKFDIAMRELSATIPKP